MVYRSGENRNALTLVRPGAAVELLSDGLNAGVEPRLSPDGTRIVFAAGVSSTDVLTYDLKARTLIRSTGTQSSSGQRFGRAEWTPQSDRVLLRMQTATDRSVLVWRLANGSGVLLSRVIPSCASGTTYRSFAAMPATT